MTSRRYFPTVLVVPDEKSENYDAAVGLSLKSLLKADLLRNAVPSLDVVPDETGSGKGKVSKRQRVREDLVFALSGLPEGVWIELRITAFPHIASRANGKIAIHLFLRSSHWEEETAREKALSAFMSLKSVLCSHLTEAEFMPVTSMDELRFQLHPFRARHAVSIERSQSIISLSTPIKRRLIGFGQEEELEQTEPAIRHVSSWRPSHDNWAALLNTLTAQMHFTELIVRITHKDADEEMLERIRSNLLTCETFLGKLSQKEHLLERQAQMIREVSLRQLCELDACCFDVGVYIGSEGFVDPVLVNVAGRSITKPVADGTSGNFYEGGFLAKNVPAEAFRACTGIHEGHGFTVSETACAFRLPDPPEEDIPGLSLRRSRTNFASLKEDKEITTPVTSLFVNAHQGIEQGVFSTLEDRFRHIFVIGQTGAGKSTFMESLILQDVRAGNGVAVMDPHGELIESVLGKIPPHREKDVIYFNMLDSKRPLGFNVLEFKSVEERDLVIDELYQTLDRIYDMKLAGGPMFENNLRGMLKLLMGDERRKDFVPTLLEFTHCYQEEGFREWLKERTSNSQTLDFLEELERTRGEGRLENISPYITSKFSRFVHDSTLRLIIGQEKTSFDFEEILNEQKILLVHLGKGRFGANASALLANQLVSRFKNAAMKRGSIDPAKRKPFFLFVDECHALPPENLQTLLSEARKFKLGLVLSTQFAGQISNDHSRSDLLSAILGNVGTIAAFRLGYNDARMMSQVFYPHFDVNDILGLPNWEGYVRMQANGESTPPFSFRTTLDETTHSARTAERIRKMSQKKYGRETWRVEKSIERRRSFWVESLK